MARKGSRGTRGQIPPPRCKAILLCERVIKDSRTGQSSIIGIFDRFNLRTFPGLAARYNAFLLLTDGIGSYAITLELHDLQTGVIRARAEGPTIDFPDRATKIEFVVEVPPIPLEHSGLYDLVVLANGQEIDRQQFQAASQEPVDEQDDAEGPGEG
jgi:hypothetical protein